VVAEFLVPPEARRAEVDGAEGGGEHADAEDEQHDAERSHCVDGD
jgi:hypothetical protein